MPKLSVAERDAFLRERGHLARIATLQEDGSPSVVPVWFVIRGRKNHHHPAQTLGLLGQHPAGRAGGHYDR